MRRLLIILGVAATVAIGVAQSPEAIRRAVREVSERAENGDPEALYQLATLTERGYDSIPRDSLRAFELYEQAAEAGLLKAQNYLGYSLLKSKKSKSDAAKGLEWLEKAAISGDAMAQSNIGYLLISSDIVDRDYEKAAYWLERAAQGGVPAASSMLGDLFRDGLGLTPDTLQAKAHYYAAVDAGFTDAAYKIEALDSIAWKGLSEEKQLERARYFYTHRAPSVAIPILNRLADMPIPNTPDSITDPGITELPKTLQPDSVSAPEEKFFSILGIDEPKQIAPDWQGEALLMLGNAYAVGAGVKRDSEKSLQYYLRAAIDARNPQAIEELLQLQEIYPDILSPH